MQSTLILDVTLFGWYSTDSAAVFLHRIQQKHGLENTELLVDSYGYLPALFRLD
mgnify:CR=1 FL=1